MKIGDLTQKIYKKSFAATFFFIINSSNNCDTYTKLSYLKLIIMTSKNSINYVVMGYILGGIKLAQKVQLKSEKALENCTN